MNTQCEISNVKPSERKTQLYPNRIAKQTQCEQSLCEQSLSERSLCESPQREEPLCEQSHCDTSCEHSLCEQSQWEKSQKSHYYTKNSQKYPKTGVGVGYHYTSHQTTKDSTAFPRRAGLTAQSPATNSWLTHKIEKRTMLAHRGHTIHEHTTQHTTFEPCLLLNVDTTNSTAINVTHAQLSYPHAINKRYKHGNHLPGRPLRHLNAHTHHAVHTSTHPPHIHTHIYILMILKFQLQRKRQQEGENVTLKLDRKDITTSKNPEKQIGKNGEN